MAVLSMCGQEFLALFVSASRRCFPPFDESPVHLCSVTGNSDSALSVQHARRNILSCFHDIRVTLLAVATRFFEV